MLMDITITCVSSHTRAHTLLCKHCTAIHTQEVPIYYANDTTISTWRNNGGQVYQAGTEIRNLIYML